ncbi:MAG: hypothetical protein LIO72_05090 [Ruminococcus sp.]|nr:hypothetical protein [Ruminococcus sp.]
MSSTSFSAVGVIDSGTVTSTASVTTDEFASGEVAYLLNNGVTNGTQVWYQTIGTDAYPVFDNTHMTVYAGTDCKGVAVYGNTQFTGTVHTYGDPSWSWTGYTSATATFTCTICNNYTETVNASITDATTSASCTDDGKIIYTASVTFNGTTYTNKQTVGLVATGHSYTVTACDWSSDYTSATLTLTCDNCSDEQPVVATEIESEVTTVAQCEDEGAVLYTAKGTYKNVEYTYSVTVASTATGHTFGSPEIVWASDNTATATVACSECGAIEPLEVTVTSSTDSYGNTIYILNVKYNCEIYTSEQKVEAVKTTTSNSDIYTTLSHIQASYTGVQAAIAKANSLNPDDYENFSAVTEAIEAVDWSLSALNQKQVNAYAEAIEEAIENLVPVETVDITEETIEVVDPVEAGDTDSE